MGHYSKDRNTFLDGLDGLAVEKLSDLTFDCRSNDEF